MACSNKFSNTLPIPNKCSCYVMLLQLQLDESVKVLTLRRQVFDVLWQEHAKIFKPSPDPPNSLLKH